MSRNIAAAVTVGLMAATFIHLVGARPRRARGGTDYRKGRRRGGSSPDDFAFRRHDEARQKPSRRTMA
jgi:hypothetical protein